MPQPSGEVVLSLRGVKAHFPLRDSIFERGRTVKAVDGVDLDIFRGEVLGLVGESGCGKTTLGKTMIQLVHATEGEVTYRSPDGDVVDLAKLSAKLLDPYRRRLQIIFQDPYSSLNPAFTIFGSLEDALRKYGIKPRSERRRIVKELLESVNMPSDAMDRYPHEFSGGQRQRIGIARALSVGPELVVCDEAVSALDVSIRAQVIELLLKLKREKNLTYVFITHDLSLTEYLCDRIAVMYLGRVVELCRAEDLYDRRLHPYTQALLSAIPRVDPGQRTQRIVLEGDPPSPVDPPSGCPFHPRCRFRQDICQRVAPKLRPYLIDGRSDHLAACHFVDAPAIE